MCESSSVFFTSEDQTKFVWVVLVKIMTKSSILIRQCILPRQARPASAPPARRASTSPQRRAAAPALAAAPKPFADIPGPLALPMLRHSAHVLPRIGNFHHAVGLGLLEGLRERYGDLVRLAKASRARPVLYVFDPEMMREVYESCATAPPRWDLKSPLHAHRSAAGTCPFQGDETKAVWASIRTLLQDPELVKNFEKAFDEIAVDATRRLGELRTQGNALNEDLETEMYRWALETLGVAALGSRLGCLAGAAHVATADDRKPEKTSMDDEIPDLCSLSKRCVSDLTPAEALVRCAREIADCNYLVRSEHTLKPGETFDAALKAFHKHYSLTEHFVLQAISQQNKDSRPEQVLFNKLRLLKRRLQPLVADFLLAGVEPLAQSALAMVYHLSLNPARQQRAHDEVCWSAAAQEAGAGVQELPYLAACAREALRLHPVTGGVVRRSTEGLTVGGYEVPAGVDIVLAHGVTSKSEKQWGRAKSFIPERWCSEGWEPLRASRAHPLASLPFGACPGAGAARALPALATRLLGEYRLEWHGPPPSMATTGVNKVQPPFYFVLQDAH